MNYCYDTYLSKTKKKIMIIVNIGLETPIKAISRYLADNPDHTGSWL